MYICCSRASVITHLSSFVFNNHELIIIKLSSIYQQQCTSEGYSIVITSVSRRPLINSRQDGSSY